MEVFWSFITIIGILWIMSKFGAAADSSKKEKIKLPVISPEVGKSQKNLKYKPISTIKRKKKNINKNESLILLSDAEMKEKYNEICNLYRTPYDLCIKCLAHKNFEVYKIFN